MNKNGMKRFGTVVAAIALSLSSALGQGFTPIQTPSIILGNAFYRCGSLTGANLNTTADQPIAITQPFSTYVVQSIQLTNPSAAVTTATGGFYTGAGKTGLAVVASSQPYSGLTTNSPNAAGSRLGATVTATALLNVGTLYFALTGAEGSAKTVDIDVY